MEKKVQSPPGQQPGNGWHNVQFRCLKNRR
jgi:hypothetical protein